MNDETLSSPDEIKLFLEGTKQVTLSLDKRNKYEWIARTVKSTGYFKLKKKEKSIVCAYMMKVTHYSRSQLDDLIRQYKTKKWIGCPLYKKTHFPKQYTQKDILLLVTIQASRQFS